MVTGLSLHIGYQTVKAAMESSTASRPRSPSTPRTSTTRESKRCYANKILCHSRPPGLLGLGNKIINDSFPVQCGRV